MRILPKSPFAPSRSFICAVAIAFVAGTAVGWSAALPPVADPTIAEAAPMKPDFDLVFASLDVVPRVPQGVKPVPLMNFDLVFASIAPPPRANTPSRREKLRNAGWRRILQSQKATPARLSAGESRSGA